MHAGGVGPTPTAPLTTSDARGGVPRGSAACAASAQESPAFRQGERSRCGTLRGMRAPTLAVAQGLCLLNEAFEGRDWHFLLGNLHSLTLEDWSWVPPGGHRSIRDMIQHVGGSEFMYHDHAFGNTTLTWDAAPAAGSDVLATSAAAIGWLCEGQERLRQGIAALDAAAPL